MAQRLTKPEEKVRSYRKAAEEAEKSALRATEEDTKNAYHSIMLTWQYLADELEREIEMGIAIDEIESDQPEDVVIPRSDGADVRKSH